ncbi:MAG: hypothetical protein MJZ20_06330 [Bacteroidaceae bacterium]|nr:hypothetical protein [Bacteroidaceae bacterium]
MEDRYLNEYHRKNSEAIMRQIEEDRLHPLSRQELINQIQRLKQETASKEKQNKERSKKETIDELNNLIKDIENGRKEFRRYNKELLRGKYNAFSRSGEANEGASLLLARDAGRNQAEYANQGAKREESAKERFERRQKEGRRQEKIIEAWAKANDLWLNDYEDPDGNTANSLEDLLNSQWSFMINGSEADVYRYDENTVLKSINLSHYDDNLQMALDKFVLHNAISPNAPLEVVGFGRDSLGHFRIIALQPYIKGTELTDKEFNAFLKELGTTEDNGWHNLSYFKVTDIAPYNIKKYHNTTTGKYEYGIIDADFRLLEEDANVDNSIVDNTKTFMDSISDEELEDEVRLIQQESADYELLDTSEEKLLHILQ